jgi:hypothetical protein
MAQYYVWLVLILGNNYPRQIMVGPFPSIQHCQRAIGGETAAIAKVEPVMEAKCLEAVVTTRPVQ